MDPVRNPYSPGAGTPPPALVGRDAHLDTFDVAVQRLAIGRSAKSLMLTGLRGVGKTVLLREFGRTAESHGWTHVRTEATEQQHFVESMATLVRTALLRLSAARRAAKRARRALGILRSFRARWNLPGGGEFSLGFDPVPGVADSGALDEDLAGLFSAVGDLARAQGTGVLFTVDEVQYLSLDELAALIVGLHRISQDQLPFMVAGAGLPSLPSLAGEARSYAERLFSFPIIDSLPAAEASRALSAPAAEEEVHWQPDALERIVELTDGYPYFLQEFGKQAWDVATGSEHITLADVEAAVPLALDELDSGFFRARIGRTTDAERAYLAAMASLGPGPYESGRVAAARGKTTSQVGPVRDALIKRGLCYAPRHGIIDFTVPMFDQFIRRHPDMHGVDPSASERGV
ncbi:AAA family ATPase [Candidatus Poriferisodalis sp.]|uniref:AAA family ATPase n=1 Tax=Candidatus Poriferisodalis sp. TaxID=3101277 RepID=UPI003B02A211